MLAQVVRHSLRNGRHFPLVAPFVLRHRVRCGAEPRRPRWAAEPRKVVSDPHPRGTVVPADVPLGFAVDRTTHSPECDPECRYTIGLSEQAAAARLAEHSLRPRRGTVAL